jgi:MFS transporter, ACS family, D-galactonate transporter
VSLPLAVAVLFIVSDELRWPTWATAIGSGVLALIVIGVIVARLRKTSQGRDIVIIYVAYIAILWNLWFFNY